MRRVLLILCLLSLASAASARTLRPVIGLGWSDRGPGHSEVERLSRHLGLQMMLEASENKSWGLEVTRQWLYESVEGEAAAWSVCILLEAKVFDWWLNQIAVAGYIADGTLDGSPFGYRSSTGVEWDLADDYSLSLLLRTDLIFTAPTLHRSSLELGLARAF